MTKKDLYLVDSDGSVPVELRRHAEIRTMVGSLIGHSATISDIVVGLREIVSNLGADRPNLDEFGRTPYMFEAETAAREELMRVSKYLHGINLKLWSVTRVLGTEADAIASRVDAAQDQKFDAELESYLKSDVPT